MKMNAAVLWEFNAEWSVEEVDLDGPQDGEVLVSFEAAGLCHSDHHVRTGDLPVPLPIVGGHEGAGVVQEVGPGVRAENQSKTSRAARSRSWAASCGASSIASSRRSTSRCMLASRRRTSSHHALSSIA